MLSTGLPCLELIQQMPRIYAGCDKSGPIADHHQEGFFPTFIDGSDLVQVDDPGPGRWLRQGGAPTGHQFGDGVLSQLALKDPSFLHGSLGDCDSQHVSIPRLRRDLRRSEILPLYPRGKSPEPAIIHPNLFCNLHAFLWMGR